mgnify:CR=1 FL=1
MLAFLIAPVFAFAQYDDGINQPDQDYKNFHFGITLGVNGSHYKFTHHPRFLQYDSVMVVESLNSTGISLAWMVDKRISDHFSFRTYPVDLIFTEKAFEYNLSYPNRPAGEDSISIRKIQGITLALPLQLKFNSDRIANFRVYMMGGGYISYDMAANKNKTNAENLMKLDKFDYGLETGLGFHLYFPMFVLTPEIKVSWGLNDMHSRDPDLKYSNVIDKINARSIIFSLTVE